MDKKLSNYDPNYPYKKKSVNTGVSRSGYPIVERMTNGVIFPEGPKNGVDFKEYNEVID